MSKKLTAQGFECHALTTSSSPLGSVDEEVEVMNRVSEKMVPPVIVAHGLGVFVALKYLESYRACGLVMISPFPHDPRSALGKLTLERLLGRGGGADSSLAMKEPSPSILMADAANIEHRVNIEPLSHFINALAISSSSDPVVSTSDFKTFCAYHELALGAGLSKSPSAAVLFEGSGGHLAMVDPVWDARDGVCDLAAGWISDNF